MFMIEQFPRAARLAAVLALLSAAALPLAAAAQPAGVDAQAAAILKRSTDYLAGLEQFSVDTHSTIEAVLTSGQKLQFDNGASASVQRPDKLRAQRKGDLVNQVFYYDGKRLTLYNGDEKFYASVAAPPTLEAMLDYARESLDIVAPAGDLLYRDAYDILMRDVQSGFVVGKSVVGGVRCDHLAFRSVDVDWQIWIQEGDKPLPRKLVITSRDVANAPQFAVDMTNWNVAPTFSARTFSFSPPAGAQKVDFLPLR